MLSLLHCGSIANAMALHRLGGTAVFHFMAQLHLRQHCWEPLNQQLGAWLLRGKNVATWRQTPERHRQKKSSCWRISTPHSASRHWQARARVSSAVSPGLLTQRGTFWTSSPQTDQVEDHARFSGSSLECHWSKIITYLIPFLYALVNWLEISPWTQPSKNKLKPRFPLFKERLKPWSVRTALSMLCVKERMTEAESKNLQPHI